MFDGIWRKEPMPFSSAAMAFFMAAMLFSMSVDVATYNQRTLGKP